MLQLHIKDKSLDERFRRRYSYKELQELESKLMLIAGKAEKGKEDVDRFTMVKSKRTPTRTPTHTYIESFCTHLLIHLPHLI